jgi:hypothetical protein
MSDPKNNNSRRLFIDEVRSWSGEEAGNDYGQEDAFSLRDSATENVDTLLPGNKCKPVLYYFPGKFDLKTYFGHVAIGNLPPTEEARSGYLTFGKASEKTHNNNVTNLVKNDVALSHPFTEKQLYGRYISIVLPACSLVKINAAIKNFTNLDRNKYSVLENNDANAAVNFLRDAGYLIPELKGMKMPKDIALLVGKIAMNALLAEREQLLNDKIRDCMLQIGNLIENDKKRLKLQLALDDISRLATSRSLHITEVKMKQLEELLQYFRVENPDYELCFKKLVKASSDIGSIVGGHLQQCIERFVHLDEQQKSAILKGRKKTEHSSTLEILDKQRTQILEEEGTDNIERICKLIDNDIQRLNKRVGRDKEGFLAKLVKSDKTKDEDIVPLESLEAMFKQKNLNYQACVEVLIKAKDRAENKVLGAKNDKKIHWQEYLEFFSFEKLAGMDDKRFYLVKLEIALQNPDLKVNGGAKRFLGKEFPPEIHDLQAMIQACKALPDAMDKDIYFLFEEITKRIRQEKDKITNPEVRAFYAEWYRASLEVRQSQYLQHVLAAA